MTDNNNTDMILAAAEQRRAERRRFLRAAGGSTVAIGGLALLASCGGDDDDDDSPSPTPSPSPSPTATPTPAAPDADVLNFALNIEYLEANFYSLAVNGTALPANLVSGSGTQGTVTGGARVAFSNRILGAYVREIALEKQQQVALLRNAIGPTVVAMPNINIDGGTAGAFTAAMRAAGVIGTGDAFDPYASENNFLLAAFFLADVGVSAYKGTIPILSDLRYFEATAGILATRAYHGGMIRTFLYERGADAANGLRVNAGRISDARDRLDGVRTVNGVDQLDLDQGVTDANGNANIVPADGNAIAFSRSVGQTLNVLYLTNTAVTQGGFYPNGANANLAVYRTSAASNTTS